MTGGRAVNRDVRRQDSGEPSATEKDVRLASFCAGVGRAVTVDRGGHEIPLAVAIGIPDPESRSGVVTHIESAEGGIGRRRQAERRWQRPRGASVDDIDRAGPCANGRCTNRQIVDVVTGDVARGQYVSDARSGNGKNAGVRNGEVARGNGSAVIVDDVHASIARSARDDLAEAVVVQIGALERGPELIAGGADYPDQRVAGRQGGTADRTRKQVDLATTARSPWSSDDQIARGRRKGACFLRGDKTGIGRSPEAIACVVTSNENMKIVQRERVRAGHPPVEHPHVAPGRGHIRGSDDEILVADVPADVSYVEPSPRTSTRHRTVHNLPSRSVRQINRLSTRVERDNQHTKQQTLGSSFHKVGTSV